MSGRGYTDEERMAVHLAREVRDGDVAGCGANSQLPAAGLLLAQASHAPDVTLMLLGTALMPFRTSRQFHFMAQRGELDLFFVSGVQIDQRGNYNLHLLGDPTQPKRRFPGGYGGMLYYAARRTVVFRTEHTRRVFVPEVDFVSAAAQNPPDVARHGRPSAVITPLATFRYDTAQGLLVLDTVHAPHDVHEVQHHTGFDVAYAGDAPVTPEPTAEELRLLREVVRPRMISDGIYADWAAKAIGDPRAA